MLDINQIHAKSARDYYGRMAEQSKGTSYWVGRGARALGYRLGDPVNPDELYALCAVGPEAAMSIKAGDGAQFNISEIEDHQKLLALQRRGGWDMTLTMEKSLSSILFPYRSHA